MSISVNEDMVPDILDISYKKSIPAREPLKKTPTVYNLTYLISGEARYTINEEIVDLTPGSLLVVPCDCACKGISFPDRLMQCFSVEFILRDSQNHEIDVPFPLISLPGRREDIVRLFHDLHFTWLDKQPGYVIKSRGLFLLILHHFMEQIIYQVNSASRDSRISRAIRYMTTHYSERISVRNMAKMVGLNPTYFGLLFRQEMGITFNRWLIQTRVKKAEDMLSSGEYKVSDVAEACGFTDVSHFYKQFKLIKGYPPSHSLPKKF